MFENVKNAIIKIKNQRSLILNITNFVTMDFVANGLLSLGASPIVSCAEQEIADLCQIAQAVVINIGTLNPEFIKLCQTTCRIANQLHKPIIFDPVGVGASRYRTESALSLLQAFDIAVIRANASEVMALAGANSLTKGVDSTQQTQEAITSAQELAKKYHCTVAMSGQVDVIVDQNKVVQHARGSALMPMITGTGCLLSAVVAAFHAVEQDSFAAAELAYVFYGVCGEIAAQQAQAPGQFRVQFLDALYALPMRDYYENK